MPSLTSTLATRPAWKLEGSGPAANYVPVDLIKDTLLREIEAFRMKSFNNYALIVLLTPAPKAHPFFDGKGRWLGWDQYTFESGASEPKSLRVRIESGQLRVLVRGRWVPVKAHLKNLEPACDPNAPIEGQELETFIKRKDHQQRWWMANGKSFKLMDLPLEIREMIYDLAFDPIVAHDDIPKTFEHYFTLAFANHPPYRPHTSLLRTSKRVYEEASTVLYRSTTFFIHRSNDFYALLPSHGLRFRIRRLELHLNPYDWLKVFGLCEWDPGHTRDLEFALALKAMKLDSLKLGWIEPPSDFFHISHRDSKQDFPLDRFLDYAWTFIRHHPITLPNCINQSDIDRFESRVLEEKQQIDKWQASNLAMGLAKGTRAEYYDWLAQAGDNWLLLFDDPFDTFTCILDRYGICSEFDQLPRCVRWLH